MFLKLTALCFETFKVLKAQVTGFKAKMGLPSICQLPFGKPPIPEEVRVFYFFDLAAGFAFALGLFLGSASRSALFAGRFPAFAGSLGIACLATEADGSKH